MCKNLMPLINAAILGGTLIFLGISTAWLLTGVQKSRVFLLMIEGMSDCNLFCASSVGAVVLVTGLLFILLFSKLLLCDGGQTENSAIIWKQKEPTVALLGDKRVPIVEETLKRASVYCDCSILTSW